jgi:hypothetical protein
MPRRLPRSQGKDHDLHLINQRRRHHQNGVPRIVSPMLRARPPGFIEPCLPSLAERGFRLMAIALTLLTGPCLAQGLPDGKTQEEAHRERMEKLIGERCGLTPPPDRGLIFTYDDSEEGRRKTAESIKEMEQENGAPALLVVEEVLEDTMTEAIGLALCLWPIAALAQVQEPPGAGGAARVRRRLRKGLRPAAKLYVGPPRICSV